MLIFNSLFLHDLQLKKQQLFVCLMLGLVAVPQFIHCLKLAILTLPPLNKFSFDWLPLSSKNLESQVGGASVFITAAE